MSTHAERAAVRQQIIRDLEAGHDVAAVAASTGYSPSYVTNIGRQAKVLPHQKLSSTDLSQSTLKVLADLIRKPHTARGRMTELAKKYKVSRQRIEQIYQRADECGLIDAVKERVKFEKKK